MDAIQAPEVTLRSGVSPETSAEVLRRRPWAAVLLVASLSIGLSLRLWLALHDDGIYWPDEIYQSLEPAHRLTFGYGLVPWEFVDGARSWAFPAFVALLLKGSVLVGLQEPRGYLTATRIVFCLIGVASAGGAYQLARALGASPVASALGASLFALSAPAIYFAPRAMGESASGLLVVVGLACALRRGARGWQVVIGTVLLGLAVFVRLQSVLFCVGLLAILAVRKRWVQATAALTALAACAFVFGLLDLLTWGSWFHSAFAYLRFNLIDGGSAQWGTSPVWYYPTTLLSAMGPAAVVLLGLVAVALRRSPGVWLLALGFVASHSLVPHKELRFLLPVLPVLCALAAVGIEEISNSRVGWAARPLIGLALVLGVVSALTFHQLNFGQLGLYVGTPAAGATAYDDSGAVNRLLLLANRRPDLCGLKVESVNLAWAGGYTYLHRPVPLYSFTGPPDDSGKFNYVIRGLQPGGPGQVVAVEGDQVLVRLPRVGCVPDPGYSSRL